MGALVEPPIAELTTIAFRKAARVRMSEGFRSSCDHPDNALARAIGHFLPVAIAVPEWQPIRQLHAERLGQRVHGRRRAHRVAIAGGGRGGGDEA